MTDAEQAVIEYLTAEPGPVTWTGPPGPSGWVAAIRSGGGEGADPATVRFSKSSAFPGCQLHHVEFTKHDGRPHWMLVRTWQQADGSWVAYPIGGGSGADPYRPRPWVNFAAAWNADLFAAGGTVTGNGAEAAHLVRLIFANGASLEDQVHNGVVLFYTSPGVAFPASVEILASAGHVLAEYDEFNDLE
jgi:hypothetical protein